MYNAYCFVIICFLFYNFSLKFLFFKIPTYFFINLLYKLKLDLIDADKMFLVSLLKTSYSLVLLRRKR